MNPLPTGTLTGGRDISTEVATQHVFAYGVGVDLTRRDMQRAAKAAGRPWDCSKGFDSSGPVGALTPVGGSEEEMRDAKRAIWLKVDGEIRQESVLGGMVWSVPEMIARLSQVRLFGRRLHHPSIVCRSSLATLWRAY